MTPHSSIHYYVESWIDLLTHRSLRDTIDVPTCQPAKPASHFSPQLVLAAGWHGLDSGVLEAATPR